MNTIIAFVICCNMVMTSHVVIGGSVTGIDDGMQLRPGQRQQQGLRKQNYAEQTNGIERQEQQRELEYYFGGDHGGVEEGEEDAFLQDGLFPSSFGYTTIVYNLNVNQAVNINAHEISGNVNVNQVSIPNGASSSPGHGEEEEEEEEENNVDGIMELVDEDGDFADVRENDQMSDNGDDHDDYNGVGETTTDEVDNDEEEEEEEEESSIPSDTPSLTPSLTPNSMLPLSYVPSDAPSLVPTNMPTKKVVCTCSSLPKCNLCFNTDPSIGDTSLLYKRNAQCCDEGECNTVRTCPTACKVIPTEYGGACVADNNSKLGRCTEIFFSNQCDSTAPVPCCLEGFGGGCYVSKCDGST